MVVGTTQAASLLGICCQRVRQLLKAGRIQGAQKVGRCWQIPLFKGMPKIIPGHRGPKGRWKILPQRATTFIHVNQLVIRQNKKHQTTEPVILVKQGKHNICCHEVDIAGVCKLVYRPDRPKACGATLWLEVEPNINITARIFSPCLAEKGKFSEMLLSAYE